MYLGIVLSMIMHMREQQGLDGDGHSLGAVNGAESRSFFVCTYA